MVELAVVGAKNSGKTTVIEGLVGYLVANGYRVAAVKHTSHSHRFDTPGKDTFRHREAGAVLTVARSEGETAVFAQPNILDIRQLQDMIDDHVDIWLIEGDRQADRPKILVTRGLDESSEGVPTNIIATIGPKRLAGVPTHFEPGDYGGLGSFVIEAMAKKKAEHQE
jgi:molybdopterin-guanine dinucleotide biosynthesis protein B